MARGADVRGKRPATHKYRFEPSNQPGSPEFITFVTRQVGDLAYTLNLRS